MKHAARVCAVVIALGAVSQAQDHQHGASAAKTPVTLRTGLGSYHHEITTTSREAQQFFDQGLTLVYGFNHGAAIRMFRRAAELDPSAPMPLWGIALALGPHINNPDVDPESEKEAAATIARAKTLAASSPARERAYIDALATRYSAADKPDLRQLDRAYSTAMEALAKQFPDDLDVQTLYAESLMDLRPWALWAIDGTPSDLTPTITSTLESVLRRDPNHPGANHYYIHAVEASPHPEKALPAAHKLDTLVPEAGHLVHMPAHIYMRTGDFDAAANSNARAAAIDERFIQQTGAAGLYPLMYYNHNVHFESAAAAMAGRFAEAKRTADKLAANVAPYIADMPMLEPFLAQPVLVLARFGKSADVLALRAPDVNLHVATAMWHYARALAYAQNGDAAAATREREAMSEAMKPIPRDTPVGVLNTAGSIFDIATAVVDARIATARGDRATAVTRLQTAVEKQDQLAYDEPPAWYYPVRESLGGALLRNGQAADAEKVFRKDLEMNPGNGRSLFGLWKALEAQQKTADAEAVKKQFDAAWKKADVQLTVDQL